MVIPAKGIVTLVPFPFSDLSASKLRPAVVLASAGRNDWILCQITSKAYGDVRSVEIRDSAFQDGGLRMTSYARPGKLFTANTSLLVSQVGLLTQNVFASIVDEIVRMLRENPNA